MTKIKVEVVYALKDYQDIVKLEVNDQSTIQSVIVQSDLLNKYAEICLDVDAEDHNKVGIYNQIKPLNEIVKNGDRIEIYRQLMIDPKEVRRKRALKQKEQGVI